MAEMAGMADKDSCTIDRKTYYDYPRSQVDRRVAATGCYLLGWRSGCRWVGRTKTDLQELPIRLFRAGEVYPGYPNIVNCNM